MWILMPKNRGYCVGPFESSGEAERYAEKELGLTKENYEVRDLMTAEGWVG